MGGLGLVTLVIGVKMATGTANELVLLAAILLGGLAGHALRLERGLETLGARLQARFAKGGSGSTFAEGFVTASLVFCVGPMTVLGSIQDGLSGDYRLLAVKSLLDFFAAIGFAAGLGAGVLASVVTVVVVQGGLTLGAGLVAGVLTDPLVREMTAAGGALVLGIGLRLLDLKRLPVADFLPALVLAPLLAAAAPAIGRAVGALAP
jgi:uncharacterized membrane protein YqgA involved in biofilm formation